MNASLLFDRAWQQLQYAVTHRRHPFHTCCLSTVQDGVPQSRIVVLRHAEGGVLGCHADVRSPKVAEASSGLTSWLFYSFPDKLQIRATGLTVVHHLDDVAESVWKQTQLLSRRCYMAPFAPGTLMDQASRNMPEGLEDREPTEEESVPGLQNFCVLRTYVREFEVLSLEFEGNLRCRFVDGKHQWLAP